MLKGKPSSQSDGKRVLSKAAKAVEVGRWSSAPPSMFIKTFALQQSKIMFIQARTFQTLVWQ